MKGRISYHYWNSPLGEMEICFDDEGIYHILFLAEGEKKVQAEILPPVVEHTCQQLDQYFQGELMEFNLPLYLRGTEFLVSVWQELKNIPYGKTINYMQLAKKLGDPKAIRAVAAANGKNPFAIVIPCHRVIGSDGSLTGYAGGLKRKKWLLDHEQKVLGTTPTLF